MTKTIVYGALFVALCVVAYLLSFTPKTTTTDAMSTTTAITALPSMADGPVTLTPVSHASGVIAWAGKTFYTDPVGGAALFEGQAKPDVILLTDIHQDHLDPATLQALAGSTTVIVAPKAVADQLPEALKPMVTVMSNGEKKDVEGFSIEAIPMYNVPEKADAYHTKGRGNGYVLERQGYRFYISGDTSNTPEMRALKSIDWALLCMNLPYTMDVTEASQAVLAFKPKKVTPYHYRGQDTQKFKELVSAGDASIDVLLMDWYPTR